MKNVRVTMADDTYDRLRVEAKSAGYPGISSYLLSKVNGLTTDAEAHDILKHAESKVKRLPVDGDAFTLKSLFTKDAWNGYSKPARISAGKLFFAGVSCGLTPGVTEGVKTGSNHQTYLRTEE
ncbi:MAG: DUF1413 domain-containing protein [Pseudomonadota bacterium]